ncbi:unnamed protein product [Umbelopsis ramanniana]
MAQTGDPLGTGVGGESVFGLLNGPRQKYFPAEIHPKLKHKKRGTVSMAVATDASVAAGGVSGSQFFITLADDLDYLDGKYTIFGEVAEGFDILDKINSTYCDENGRPYRDIRIRHTIVLDDPFPDPEGLQVPDESPLPTKEQMESMRIGEDEDIEEHGDPEELEKRRREREAKAQALTLEMVGDLPFAEVKPPENVLFVCKLNPVTRDEDLEMIFSRFGHINSCEVIRDRKSGDSLGYAFIEFDNKEDCEEAFFKMQSVLIDDRRIHVDFSQSVSKLHTDWISKRLNNQSATIGGVEGLEKRKRYREENAHERGDDYDLVFEPSSKRSKDRDRGREKEHNREKDRNRDRDRDRGRGGHRDRGKDDDRSRGRENDRDQDRRRDGDRHRARDGDRDRDRDRDSNRGRDRDRERGDDRRRYR